MDPSRAPQHLAVGTGKIYCSVIVSGYCLSQDQRVLKLQMKLTLLTLVLTEAIVFLKVRPRHLLPRLTWLTVQHKSHFSVDDTSILFYYYLTLAEMLLPLIIDFNPSCVCHQFMKERKISDAMVSHPEFLS